MRRVWLIVRMRVRRSKFFILDHYLFFWVGVGKLAPQYCKSGFVKTASSLQQMVRD